MSDKSEEFSSFGFGNSKDKNLPDSSEYRGYARGQLKAILNSMENNKMLSEEELERFVRDKGWRFSSQSFHAQVRMLRKPDNGGYCLTSEKRDGIMHYTLHGKHGAVAKCDKCDFAPYKRLDAQDAVDLYRASKDGDFSKVEKYMADFLSRCGLKELLDEHVEEPDYFDLLGDDL